ASPAFADADADGDLDLFIGNSNGNTLFFRNTAAPGATAPAYAPAITNPFGISSVDDAASPAFADADADGDLDLFIGELYGNTVYFRNTAASGATAPAYAPATINPFGISAVGFNARPAFADADADGDLDLFIGNNSGDTVFFRNTAATPVAPVSSSNANGSYGIGAVITLTVQFSEAVVVITTGGIPTLKLETGVIDDVARFVSGSGTNTLSFTYNVGVSHFSRDLDQLSANALTLNGGTIRDTAGNNAILTLAAPGATASLGANKALVIDGFTLYTTIENQGNTKLLRGGNGIAFVETGAGRRQEITVPWGVSATVSDNNEWEMLAADTITGVNQALWRNNSTSFLYIWNLDANWNLQSTSGAYGFNTPKAWELETSFQVDGNRDGIIGAPFTTLEAQGNTKLLRRGDGLAFVETGAGRRQETTAPWGVSATGSDNNEWEMLAAEKIGDTNQVLWRNNTASFLHIWNLDSNWSLQSTSGAYGFNTPNAWELETSFQVDGNRDGIIGAPLILL
ncbi:MAG: FG-GAP-like repeat-containing protein, partial [Cyanobacteria bacterium]|nr:FG-GAP-like repeat-containing protein [Cyanobacteriota bacterium]